VPLSAPQYCVLAGGVSAARLPYTPPGAIT